MGEGGARRGPARRAEEAAEGGEGSEASGQERRGRKAGEKEENGASDKSQKARAEKKVLILRSAQRARLEGWPRVRSGASWFSWRCVSIVQRRARCAPHHEGLRASSGHLALRLGGVFRVEFADDAVAAVAL